MTPSAFTNEIDLTCPQCEQTFPATITHVVLPDTPDWDALNSSELNRIVCPHCQTSGLVAAPFLVLHADTSAATCYAPGFDQLDEEEQQTLVSYLYSRLLEGLESLELPPVELAQIGISEEYDAVALLVQSEQSYTSAEEASGAETAEDASVQEVLTLLQTLINTDPTTRQQLIAQLGAYAGDLGAAITALLPELQEAGLEPETLQALRELRAELLNEAPPVTAIRAAAEAVTPTPAVQPSARASSAALERSLQVVHELLQAAPGEREQMIASFDEPTLSELVRIVDQLVHEAESSALKPATVSALHQLQLELNNASHAGSN